MEGRKSYPSVTSVPLSLLVFCFILGFGEGQCETEADARFCGCKPKQVGRDASKKTAGLSCPTYPCQPHGGWGERKLKLCPPRAAAKWLQLDESASVQPHHPFVPLAQTDLKSPGMLGSMPRLFHLEVWSVAEWQEDKGGGGAGSLDPQLPLMNNMGWDKGCGQKTGLDPGTWGQSAQNSESVMELLRFVCALRRLQAKRCCLCSLSPSTLLCQTVPRIQICIL